MSPLSKSLLSIVDKEGIIKLKKINVSRYNVFEEFKKLAQENKVKLYESQNPPEVIITTNSFTFERSFLV